MAFRHVVLLRFTEDATDEQRQTLVRGLDSMPEVTGAVRADGFRHGPDAGISPGNWDYVVVADFATEDEYLAYREHPDHQALIRDLLKPILADRAAIQYEYPG